MTTERVTVTPEMAAELLGGDDKNRELSEVSIIKYKEHFLSQLLVGKEVRVYSEGQPLTQDFVIDRVNIEIDFGSGKLGPDTIKRVWFG